MSKIVACDICNSKAELKQKDYQSGENDTHGVEIIVPNVNLFYCTNSECNHTWLPTAEEDRIEKYILQKSRNYLKVDEIELLRKAMNFSTKTAAANFLTLNSKAFTKWENSYTDLNSANDLLLRLAVFSDSNFNFIKELHNKKFQFDPNDYQLVSRLMGGEWKHLSAQIHSSSNDTYTSSALAAPSAQPSYGAIHQLDISATTKQVISGKSYGEVA